MTDHDFYLRLIDISEVRKKSPAKAFERYRQEESGAEAVDASGPLQSLAGAEWLFDVGKAHLPSGGKTVVKSILCFSLGYFVCSHRVTLKL